MEAALVRIETAAARTRKDTEAIGLRHRRLKGAVAKVLGELDGLIASKSK